jgi:hypothetical protein
MPTSQLILLFDHSPDDDGHIQSKKPLSITGTNNAGKITYQSIVMVSIVLFLFLFITCAPDTQVTGNSSETINGIRIASGNRAITGKTRAFATVDIYSKDYWPHIAIDSQRHSDFIYVKSLHTGKNGSFSFIDLRSGSYNVIVSDSSKSEFCYISKLDVLSDTTIHYVSDSLFKSGSIQGTISKDTIFNKTAIIFIPGTPYYVETNKDGSFMIENIPKGTFSLYLDYVALSADSAVNLVEIYGNTAKELGIIEVQSDSVSKYNKSLSQNN